MKINKIGTRHGEKQHESMLSREEMARAKDMGAFYSISPDERDLNYSSYFVKGDKKIEKFNSYSSENTKNLDVDDIVKVLNKLEFIKKELKNDYK